MGFSLGSDVGLIGLPGSIASGDSGWLAVGELIWTVWKKRQATAATHPLYRERRDPYRTRWRDLRRSGGIRRIIARYTQDRWQVELGWVNTFETDDNPGLWNDWWLGHGVHTKLRYAF
jgi:hypothetical protein